MTAPDNPLLVALDTADAETACALATRLAGEVGGVKLGLEFFTANGPAGVAAVADAGVPVFLDLKFHDIPATMAGAVRSATGLGAFMLTLHASAGHDALAAARRAADEAAAETGRARPWLVGVTVLTSLDDAGLASLGVNGTTFEQVERLAGIVRDAGLDGVVCSGVEANRVGEVGGHGFLRVVPGVRGPEAAADDQRRVLTPDAARRAGADFLVVGRPVTRAGDPVAAARTIVEAYRAATAP